MDAVTSDSPLPDAEVGKRDRRLKIATWVSAIMLVATLGYSADLFLHDHEPGAMVSPLWIAGLMVANLVPAIVLMVLLSREIAVRRGHEEGIGGKLHTRMVGLFSVIAAVPTVFVAIFASLLIQSGLEFWFSERARSMFENTVEIARTTDQLEVIDVSDEASAMAADVAQDLAQYGWQPDSVRDLLTQQLYFRKLFEGAIINVQGDGRIDMLAGINNYDGMLDPDRIGKAVKTLQDTPEAESVDTQTPDRFAVLTRLDYGDDTYLYVARPARAEIKEQISRASKVQEDYQKLLAQSRTNQLRFNGALLIGSIIIVGFAILAALKLADRLARPVGQLVHAAGRVEEGDFSTRVPELTSADEISTLAVAFNRMTQRIEEQTGELLSANAQLDTRRAFMEAVLSSVTAGVIALDENDHVLLTNRSAAALLGDAEEGLDGRDLAEISPELDEFMIGEAQEANAIITTAAGQRTLAVKRVRYADGAVLTFDDITDQLSDQRRAAWSDIARRIAHEIKNPLTPIQLAAERLQRRYGGKVDEGDETFERLTGTIVRQVADLRRMVDEFSNFARMPKPIFRDENVHDIARAALFLHEVAHPGVTFTIDPKDEEIRLVCDRRQLSQALTNIVKNAVEAIEARRKAGTDNADGDRVDLKLRRDNGDLIIDVTDTGIGLPEERERLTEPYMTTRVRGTGLGLAIVKKIVEEHLGEIAFLDRPGGGTHVRILFPAERLADMATDEPAEPLVKRGDDDEYDEEVS